MGATLKLQLTDAGHADLNDKIQVDLYDLHSSTHLQSSASVKRELLVTDIPASPAAQYRLMLTPVNHRIVQIFVQLEDGQTKEASLSFPVAPKQVKAIAAPGFAQLPGDARRILDQAACPAFLDGASHFLTGDSLYRAFDSQPLLKACFLNIVAKSAATPLSSGQSCLNLFGGLRRIAQDRLYLQTSAALWEETQVSHSFHPVSAALHDPLPEYRIVGSYKTFDRYGNLQLTFQRRGETGDDYVIDVDIDDAQGIEHLFQVLRNSVAGPTNPYDIHDILLQQQPRVDPGYSFVFVTAAALSAGSSSALTT